MKRPQKRRCRSVRVSSLTDEGVDRISQLPEHLLHHIMSFLTTKDGRVTLTSSFLTTKDNVRVTCSSSKLWNAAITRSVSKTWNKAWDSYPVLEFDQRVFENFTCKEKASPKKKVQNFCNYVENSITRHKSDISLQKLQIIVDLYGQGRYAVPVQDIHRWLNIAKTKKVRSLSFQCRKNNAHKDQWRYELDESLFCSKSMEELDLFGCKFLEDGIKTTSFGFSLRKLSLVHVRVDQISLQSFLSSCCNAEEICIQYCSEFETVKLAGVNLKRVDCVLSRTKLQTIILEAPSLQHIQCGGQWDNIKRSILGSDCKNLKELVVCDSGTESDIKKVVSLKFPLIEKVTMRICCQPEKPDRIANLQIYPSIDRTFEEV